MSNKVAEAGSWAQEDVSEIFSRSHRSCVGMHKSDNHKLDMRYDGDRRNERKLFLKFFGFLR